MMTEKALRAGLVALALALLPGCELLEEDPAGPAEHDLSGLNEVVDSVNARLASVTLVLDMVAEVSDVLAQDGVDLDVLGVVARSSDSRDLELEEIPPSLHGAVYVRNASTHEYERDPERTDGPEDGIRVVRYRRLSTGELLIPLAEGGSLDVTQEDPAAERFGLALRDADGGVLVEFTVEGEDAANERARDLEGTLGEDPPLVFSLISRHESFSGGSMAFFEGMAQAAGLGGVRVQKETYRQEESDVAEGFQEGGFNFEVNGETSYASGWVQVVSNGDPDEIEGYLDVGAGLSATLNVSGTLAAPTFETAEGSDQLSSADRARVQQIWADLVAFVDAWWVPIGG